MIWIIYIHIGSPFLLTLHIKFGFDWPSGFRGEDLCNCGRTTDGRTTDDGRTPDHGLPLSSPCEPNGSGELITDGLNRFYMAGKVSRAFTLAGSTLLSHLLGLTDRILIIVTTIIS